MGRPRSALIDPRKPGLSCWDRPETTAEADVPVRLSERLPKSACWLQKDRSGCNVKAEPAGLLVSAELDCSWDSSGAKAGRAVRSCWMAARHALGSA